MIGCICQICSCGKHDCFGKSENTEKPPPLSARMPTEYREKFAERHAAAVQLTNQHKDDWQPLEGPMVKAASRSYYGTQRVHTPFVTKANEHSEMASHSVYRDHFQAWNDPPQKVHPYIPCDNLKVNRETFSNSTTNKDSFCPMNTFVKVRESLKPTPAIQEILPFDGTTSYRSQYVLHPMQPRTPKLVRPASEAWARDMGAPMSTTMKDDYKAWATGRRAAMVPRQPELERPTGPFAKITTFRSSYTPKVAQRAVSFKPRPTPLSRGHWLEEATAEQVRRCPVQDDGSTPPTGFQYHSVDAGGHRLYRTRD